MAICETCSAYDTNQSGNTMDGMLDKSIDQLYTEGPVAATMGISDDEDCLRAEGVSQYNRTLIEICCGLNSTLCKPSVFNKGCRRIRITQRNNFADPETIKNIKTYIKESSPNCVVWFSLPCTGGCIYNSWNYKYGSNKTRRKILNHKRLFNKLWANAVIIMDFCQKHGSKTTFSS